MAEEVKRSDFGISDRKLGIKGDANSIFKEPIETDYDSILLNPINKVLSEFEKEFMLNERLAQDLLKQLNESLNEVGQELENNPIYDNMDIVKSYRNIQLKFLNWASILRRNIFLGKDKMNEVNEIVKDKYIPKKTYENFQRELEHSFYENLKKYGIKNGDENGERR